MHPFSDRYPKPALPICNKPQLQYQIEMIRDIGITEILLVIGHLGHEIVQVLGDGRSLGVTIRYVEQTKPLGIANALGQLERFVNSPVLLMLGDIFFVANDLQKMVTIMREREASAVIAVKREDDPRAIQRNFAIIQNDDGSVRRVIEKPRHSVTNYKGCGVYLFDLQVFDAIRRTPRTAMRDEYEITDSIQIMVDDGLPVYPAEVIEWDVNLTFPADVMKCNLFQLGRLGMDTLIGEATEIHPGAELHRAVVGDRVAIRHPIRINDTVIFPDTVVTSTYDIDRFIITPEHEIDCRTFIREEND